MLRQASAIILVRDSSTGIEVCMLRRSASSKFAAGAYVFPGGVVEESDAQLDTDHFINGIHEQESIQHKALRQYKTAAVRETLEESGILVSTSMGDKALGSKQRENFQNGIISLDVLLKELGVKIDLNGLIFYDHWITPEGAPIRFDTRFFLAGYSGHQELIHNEQEMNSSCWASSRDIIDQYERKQIKLMPVTHVQLKRLSEFSTIEALFGAAKKSVNIDPILPVLNYSDSGEVISVSIPLIGGVVEYPVFLKQN